MKVIRVLGQEYVPVEEVIRVVAALRDARLQIEYLHEKFCPTGSGNAVLSRIEDVLKEITHE